MRKKALTAVMIAAIPITMAAIDREEGNALKAYRDAGGVPTIGRGITKGVTMGMEISEAESDQMTLSEALYFADVVHAALPFPPTPVQSAGLTVFAYNVGTGAFLKSTLLKKLRARDPAACDQILRWVYVGPRDCRKEKGLKNGCYGIVGRRERERLACLSVLPAEWRGAWQWPEGYQ